jgi:hypothetical protein
MRDPGEEISCLGHNPKFETDLDGLLGHLDDLS